jgi:hypothetical protein
MSSGWQCWGAPGEGCVGVWCGRVCAGCKVIPSVFLLL